MSEEFIRIGGAREHNLKNLTLEIPRDKLVVITGMRGSGKSSLACSLLVSCPHRTLAISSLHASSRVHL